MFTRFLQFFGGGEKKRLGLTKEELDRMDIDFDEDSTAFDYEKIMIKNGLVVGTTATINVQNAQIKATEASDV